MPWKACTVMDERMRFVAQLLEGEPMTEVCRAFSISRKTGYKIFTRYKEHGLAALTYRSRRPAALHRLGLSRGSLGNTSRFLD
jgi:transposase